MIISLIKVITDLTNHKLACLVVRFSSLAVLTFRSLLDRLATALCLWRVFS
jgi:hypothetical protein